MLKLPLQFYKERKRKYTEKNATFILCLDLKKCISLHLFLGFPARYLEIIKLYMNRVIKINSQRADKVNLVK